MKVILLSGGYGERLRPLTYSVPKCLAPINGVPLLEIWLNNLKKANLGPILVNTHYLRDQVEDFINSLDCNNNIQLIYEPKLLGTAGTLINNIDFYKGEDGLLIHADNYCRANLSEFIDAHKKRPSECLMTMLSFKTDSPSSCGILELDNNNVVKAIHEKVDNPPGQIANGAVYILSNKLLELLSKENKPIKDFSLEVLPRLIGKIFAFETKEFFIDIGTLDSYKKANTVDLELKKHLS
jgi:mannose-1-phosphate guanylyltransferase